MNSPHQNRRLVELHGLDARWHWDHPIHHGWTPSWHQRSTHRLLVDTLAELTLLLIMLVALSHFMH